jgi:hypothetical protein
VANQSKAEASAALKEAGIERQAFTIPQFCARNGDISESFYRKMREKKLGPRETYILDRIIIFREDETEWQQERRAEAEAERIEAERIEAELEAEKAITTEETETA